MKRTIPGIVRLLLSLPLMTACVSAPSETLPPERMAAQVLEDVCLPHVADGVPFETVKRALDFAWSQDWPELLVSGPPGPVLRQRFSPTRGVLTFVTARVDPPWGMPRQAGCQLSLHGATAPAVIAAVGDVMDRHQGRRQTELSGYVVASWCVRASDGRTASVWALDYRDGRTGVAVNAVDQPCA